MKACHPEDQYKEFLKEFSQSTDELGIFLKKNFWLIIKTARKRFGSNFDVDEIVSDAAEAYERMKYYHNRSKAIKHTSSYTWFPNKQFDKSFRNGVITLKTWDNAKYSESDGSLEERDSNEILDRLSHNSLFGGEESMLEPEEEMLYGSSMVDLQDTEEDTEDFAADSEAGDLFPRIDNSNRTKVKSHGPRYLICFESFKGLLSTGLYMILSALSERKMRRNLKHYEKLLENRRSIGDVCKLLRSNLAHEISQAGCHLYIAVCVNGTRNNVLVAATSEEKAREHLIPYGEMIELRQMEVWN